MSETFKRPINAIIWLYQAEEPETQWGLNIRINDDDVVFEQGPKQVRYCKDLIRTMILTVDTNK